MNVTDKIKNLSFSEKDFDVIFDGLNLAMVSPMRSSTFMDVMSKAAREIEKPDFDSKDIDRKVEEVKKEMREGLTLLQAKLIHFKKLLIENGLLDTEIEQTTKTE